MGLKNGRDAYFDNAKGLLIFLVVLGHALEPLATQRSINILYRCLFVFHIPLFVLISGHFSSAELGLKQAGKLIASLLIPYFLFEFIYEFAHVQWLAERPFSLTIMTPHWILWFLVSLLCWRLMLPLVMAFRWPLAVAIGLGLASGMIKVGYYLSLSRTLMFFPFFVLGHQLERSHFEYLRRRPVRVLLLVLAVLVVYVIQRHSHMLHYATFYGSFNYEKLRLSELWGTVSRAAIYLGALIMGGALMSLTPKKRSFLTTWGERSLYVYLFHGLAIKYAIHSGWFKVEGRPSLLLLWVALACAATTVIFSSKPVHFITRYLVEPPVGWLLRPKAKTGD